MLRTLFSLIILAVIALATAFVLSSFAGVSLSDLPKDYLERLKYVGIERVEKDEFRIVKLKIGILGDSHNDNDNLSLALDELKRENVDFVVHLGDFTQVGTIENLKAAKKVLDLEGLEYYVIPGEHDTWKSVGPENFISVFGKSYQAFEKKDTLFLLIDNSDVYNGMSDDQMVFIDHSLKEFKGDIYIFISNPLYHYSSPRVFGFDPKTFEEIPAVSKQRDRLLALARNAEVKAIIAGDLHYSERYNDLKKIELMHFVNGALTNSRNLQTPRFSILTIYDNGEYGVEEIVL